MVCPVPGREDGIVCPVPGREDGMVCSVAAVPGLDAKSPPQFADSSNDPCALLPGSPRLVAGPVAGPVAGRWRERKRRDSGCLVETTPIGAVLGRCVRSGVAVDV